MNATCEVAERICDICRLLKSGAKTRKELNAAVSVNPGTLRRYMKAMQDKGMVREDYAGKPGGEIRYVWLW